MNQVFRRKWDFLIIAALEEEFSYVRHAFDSSYEQKEVEESEIGRVYSVLLRPEGEKNINVMIGSPRKMGRISAAIFTTYLITKFDFSWVALTGIAGGLRFGNTKNNFHGNINQPPNLGDILFAESIIDIDMGKITDPELYNFHEPGSFFIQRSRAISIDSDVIAVFNEFRENRTQFFPRLKFRSAGKVAPNSFIGPFLSTNMVIANVDEAKRLADNAVRHQPYHYPLAVEMESYGVAEAVKTILGRNRLFIIKSVNDYASSSKNDDEEKWRAIACNNAAIATRNFVEYLHKSGISS